MSGEVVATSTAFSKSSYITAGDGSTSYTTLNYYARGNVAQGNGWNRTGIYDDTFIIRIYYWNGSGWTLSNSLVVPDNQTTTLSCYCSSSHSHYTHWLIQYDATPYGDGKARMYLSAWIKAAYDINHSSYPKGNHLSMRLMSNFGVSTSNVAPTYYSNTAITTGYYVTT